MKDDLASFLENYRGAASLPTFIKDAAQKIIEDCTPAQREFVLDQHRSLVLTAPRRVGKTSAFLRKFCRSALLTRGGHYVYAALSRPHAEALLWQPLKEFAASYKIAGRFYESDLVFQEQAWSS